MVKVILETQLGNTILNLETSLLIWKHHYSNEVSELILLLSYVSKLTITNTFLYFIKKDYL